MVRVLKEGDMLAVYARRQLKGYIREEVVTEYVKTGNHHFMRLDCVTKVYHHVIWLDGTRSQNYPSFKEARIHLLGEWKQHSGEHNG